MKIITDTNEWLSWRQQGIGASDIGALFGVHPFSSPTSLWQSIKLGSNKYQTAYMKMGKDFEAAMMPRLRRWMGKDIQEQVCMEHPEHKILRCTLDGYIEEASIIIELKYIHNKSKYPHITQPLPHHKLQLQQQLMISGALMAIYICSTGLEPDGSLPWKGFIEVPDPIIQQKIKDKSYEFWTKYVLTNTPPESTKHMIHRSDEECVRKCQRVLELRGCLEEMEALKEELRNMGGDNPYNCLGVRYSCTHKEGSIRYKDIVALPCVQEAMHKNGISIDQFKDPSFMQKRIYFSPFIGMLKNNNDSKNIH